MQTDAKVGKPGRVLGGTVTERSWGVSVCTATCAAKCVGEPAAALAAGVSGVCRASRYVRLPMCSGYPSVSWVGPSQLRSKCRSRRVLFGGRESAAILLILH